MDELGHRKRRWSALSAEDRQAERRRLLIETGIDLIGGDGWAALTVRRIIERAQLNPRYFYESFADIEQLAVAVYDRIVEELGAQVLAQLSTPGRDETEVVRAGVQVIVEFIDADRRRGRILYAEAPGLEAVRRRRVEAGRAVVGFVEQYAASQRPVPATDIAVGRVGAAFLVGGVSHLLAEWTAGHIKVSKLELIDDVTAMFLAVGDAAGAIAGAAAAVPTGRRGRTADS
ncbi:MAG TPA: TetR family transcriptional regulator [Acidimicrobiales bacterium]|nr:TetR family transcriptional regulator [Acidimicrobiales bacterium]